MDNDFIFVIKCNCGGYLSQTGKFEKRYDGRRTFKCDNCYKTTTLTPDGVQRRAEIIKNGK